MEENNFNTTPSLKYICHACLSRNRTTFSLGVYRDTFARLTPLYKTDYEDIKLCWECLAMLRRCYMFEQKCYIAQKLLSDRWSNGLKSLSKLSVTPVNIQSCVIKNENDTDITDTEVDIKEEETPNNNVDNFDDNYDNKYDDEFDEPYDEPFVHINKSEPDVANNYDDAANDKTEELKINNKNDIKLIDVEVNIKLNCDIETRNTVKENEDSTVKTDNVSQRNLSLNEDRTVNTNNVSQCNLSVTDKVKLNGVAKVKTDLKAKRVIKDPKWKALLDHYRILTKQNSQAKYLKVKIEEEQLEEFRNAERNLDFFAKKLFKCNDCIFSFQKMSDLSRHNKNVHDESIGRLTCDLCKARLATKTDLASHVAKHYYAHECTECHFRCYSKQLIRSHLLLHKRSIQCLHCALEFSTITLFSKHFKANHSVFVCDHCGKKCRTKYTLEKHMRQHNKIYACETCNKVYKSRHALKSHFELKHTEESGELSYCVQCDKQFANVALYKRHLSESVAHAPERNRGRIKQQVKCPLCEKVYSRKAYMMNHYRHVHMKQSKHYCVDCDKHFLNRTKYVQHRKYQHDGEQRVKDKMCNICGRGFAQNTTLRNHILTHSGERPYECAHCDASFTQKHCMVSHVKNVHVKSKRRKLS